MKKLVSLFCASALILSLSACVGVKNGFVAFYQGRTAEQAAEKVALVPFNGNPEIRQVDVSQGKSHLLVEMFSQGYEFLGESQFEGPSGFTDSSVAVQAKKVGASVALWGRKYVRTHTGYATHNQINMGGPQTTEHSGMITGDVFGTYTGTSTTYQPTTVTTTTTPYSVDRYAYYAGFFAKVSKIRSGLALAPINDNFKRKYDIGYGMGVYAVVKDSPAYKANILRGDVVIELNGKPFYEGTRFVSGENKVKIKRDGKDIIKTFTVED